MNVVVCARGRVAGREDGAICELRLFTGRCLAGTALEGVCQRGLVCTAFMVLRSTRT